MPTTAPSPAVSGSCRSGAGPGHQGRPPPRCEADQPDRHPAGPPEQRVGATVVGCTFVIDLPELGGAKKLEALGVPVKALCAFEGH